MAQPRDHDRQFIEHLEKLLDNRGALAALRRGLGKPPGRAPEMHPYVVPWLPAEPSAWAEAPYYLVAALFAYWHQGRTEPDRSPPENLGASFARLRDEQRRQSGQEPDSTERRFVGLLNSHPDDLPQHLRHAVALLRSHDVAVDWAQLLQDIRDWGWESRGVQRRWARSFWRKGAPKQPGAQTV